MCNFYFNKTPTYKRSMVSSGTLGKLLALKGSFTVTIAKLANLANLPEIVILSAARTPVGSFRSQLASVPAVQLGSIAIEAALKRANVQPNVVQEVFMGEVCQASLGQDPARQATLGAGLSESTITTTVNKVCASGLKAIMLAAQSLQTGHQQVTLGGGMESMSRVPFYIHRGEVPYGGSQIIDGIVNDGLTDAYEHIHMGVCAEKTAQELDITREEQDNYAIQSYKRSAAAWDNGLIGAEICPVTVKSRKGDTVIDRDEEYVKINFEKIKTLRTVFKENGTVTAGNASTLNDGAAAVLLTTAEHAKVMGIKPMAKIIAFGDAATKPVDYSIAPVLVIPKILKAAGLDISDIDIFEINEAFSLVVLANIKQLGLDPAKVNPHGGAVSIGHPIGMSGARLITHLAYALKPGQKGLAAVCNGGGGASGMIVEKF